MLTYLHHHIFSMPLRKISLIILFLPFTTLAQGQSTYLIEELVLTVPDDPLEKNLMEFRLSDRQYQDIVESKGEKINLKDEAMHFNGEKLPVKSAHLRGNTSLYLPRKSYSISLHDQTTFLSKALKDFYLISLSMDRNYFKNHLAFDLMHKAQLFGLFYTYTELKINDISQGIYLLIQRPQDYALKDLDAPFVIRRGYNHQIDKYKAEKHLDKKASRAYMKQFRELYKLCNKYEEQALYDSLNLYLDLPMYMRWIAFNYLIKDGDYADEIYFYVKPDDERFALIPWDYDDIFRAYPHEGKGNINPALEGKLIFSGEDRLDLTIARDATLYQAYLKAFASLLTALPDPFILQTFQNVYKDLYPYFQDEAVIAASKYDPSGQTNLPSLENEMRTIYTNLMYTKIGCQQQISEASSH